MSAAELTPSHAASTVEPNSPEEHARAGYMELLALLTKRGPQTWDGVTMGTPHTGILIGMCLSNAAPVFLDPFDLNPPILGVMGDEGTGRRFACELLRYRAKWRWPNREVVVNDGSRVVDYPERMLWAGRPHRRVPKGVTPRAVLAPLDSTSKMALGLRGEHPKEWAFRGLLFRMAAPPAGDLLKPKEREWLPRARLPKEAGYGEGLLVLSWMTLPIAVVASTPEYEFLTSRAPIVEPVVGG
jgi:hypothetical protein